MNGGLWAFRRTTAMVIALTLMWAAGCTRTIQGGPEPSGAASGASDGAPGSATDSQPSSAPHELTLDVSGDGAVTSLTYEVNGESTTSTAVVLPWTKSFSIPSVDGPHAWSLTVEQSSGYVEMVASLDGGVVAMGSGTGPNTGTLSGEIG